MIKTRFAIIALLLAVFLSSIASAKSLLEQLSTVDVHKGEPTVYVSLEEYFKAINEQAKAAEKNNTIDFIQNPFASYSEEVLDKSYSADTGDRRGLFYELFK